MVRFCEVQRFVGQPWMRMALVVMAVSSAVVPFALWHAEGAATVLGTLVGALVTIALVVLFAKASMRTVVEEGAVIVQVAPLMRPRRIALTDIRHCWARTYRPIREYGGWGIRGLGRNRAYNVSGDRGVQLVLADGARILLGSHRAEELATSIVAHAASRGHSIEGEPRS